MSHDARRLPDGKAPTYPGPVVWVSPYLQRGGTEHHILYLLEAVRWGVPPVLVAPPGPLASAFEASGARLVPFHDLTGNWWRGVRSFREAIARALGEVATGPGGETARPVLHVHGAAELAWLAAPIARRRQVAVLFTAHGYFGPGARWSYRIGARLLRQARIPVIAVSEDEKARWVRHGYPAQHITVVHHGVPDPDVSDVGGRDRLGGPGPATERGRLLGRLGLALPPDAVLVAVLARLEPQKGVAILIDAVARVAARLPRLRVVIMGEGSLRGDLEAQARRQGVADRVLFAGSVPRAASLLPAFHAVCLPSLDESFGLVLIEAMAAGCAVIASRVGGVPEVVRDGVDGVLVPPGDPQRLADALHHVLAVPGRLQAMRLAARQHYEQAFTAHRMAHDTLAVYRSVSAEPW